MASMTLGFHWFKLGDNFNDHDSPGRWAVSRRDCPEGEELLTFLVVDLEFQLDAIVNYVDITEGCVSGEYDAGYMGSHNDGFAAYGGGNVLLASHYVDMDRVLLSADEFLRTLGRVRAAMEHGDYRNPNADISAEVFQDFTIELLATGAESSAEFVKRGGTLPT